jgi:NitT/TauT family transport system permease protein
VQAVIRRRESSPWISVALLLVIVLCWEVAARTGAVEVVLVSSPTRIARSASTLLTSERFVADLGYSLSVFASAVALALVVGAPTGLIMGHSPLAHRLIHPLVVAFNALPKVALMPLIVLWVGLGRPAGVLLATLMASFPIIIATASGLRALERDHVQMARAFGAPWPLLLRRVVLPGVTPHVVSGLRVGVSYALVGVIIAEFFAASRGLGYRMVVYMQNFEVDAFFVCLLAVAGIALASTASLRAAELRVQAWRPDAFESAS